MDLAEAKSALLYHSGITDKMAAKNSFVTSLRPYAGLNENNFHEVMEALFAVAEGISESPHLDRRITGCLWNICYLGRSWGVHPEGMLRRNDLISDDDVDRLDEWINIIEWSSLALVEGTGPDGGIPEEASHLYAQYVGEQCPGSSSSPGFAKGSNTDL